MEHCGSASRLANKLRRQQRRTRMKDSRERNLAVALNEIQRIGSRMDLPKTTRSESAFIYKKAVDKKLVRGRSIEGVAAACIYMTCRIHRIPRTLDEIGLHSRTGRKEIGRTYRALQRIKVKVPPSSARITSLGCAPLSNLATRRKCKPFESMMRP